MSMYETWIKWGYRILMYEMLLGKKNGKSSVLKVQATRVPIIPELPRTKRRNDLCSTNPTIFWKQWRSIAHEQVVSSITIFSYVLFYFSFKAFFFLPQRKSTTEILLVKQIYFSLAKFKGIYHRYYINSVTITF